MTEKLPAMNTPDWLSSITADQIKNETFPLEKILKDSFYYPCAGFDGDPVKYFGGNFFSFVYVDYGIGKEKFLEKLHDPGFLGYQLIAGREVTQQELVPKGWTPEVMPSRSDMVNPSDLPQKPFCYWSIFERSPDFSDSHGPRRFSLLYLCADGAAAYQALYNSKNIVPKAIAVIRPGLSWLSLRGNWTYFEDPTQIFGRSVIANPAGLPEYFVHDGRSPLWNEHYDPEELGQFVRYNNCESIKVWRKK